MLCSFMKKKWCKFSFTKRLPAEAGRFHQRLKVAVQAKACRKATFSYTLIT
jgi:hypothetical protein